MASLFGGLLRAGHDGNVSGRLEQIKEVWLRLLRDQGCPDYRFHFSLNSQRQPPVICFDHPGMGWEERETFGKLLTSVLRTYHFLGLKRLTPRLLSLPRAQLGCHAKYEIRKLHKWSVPELPPTEARQLVEVLEDYGRRVAEEFRRFRAANDPNWLRFWAEPVVYLPAVWVHLQPKPGRAYPTLKGYPGHLDQDLERIVRTPACSDSRFRVACKTETQISPTQRSVNILFDFQPTMRGKEHVQKFDTRFGSGRLQNGSAASAHGQGV